MKEKKNKIPRASYVALAFIMIALGFLLGVWLGEYVITLEYFKGENFTQVTRTLIQYGIALGVGLVCWVLTAPVYRLLNAVSMSIERLLTRYSSKEILMGMIGLLIGVLLAVLVTVLADLPVSNSGVKTAISIVTGLLLGYIGMRIGARMLYDILPATNVPRPARMTSQSDAGVVVLDASSVIDGRVLDLVRTGFLAGKVIIPNEVLIELGRIADSDDVLKQNRGRRGLDIVTALQKEKNITVSIPQRAVAAKDTDEAVMASARESKGRIITNDYNFGKLAIAQKLEVLNINDLAGAIRPIALPGEKMVVKIVKAGKEQGQGVAYTPDGTMIVVENGGGNIGCELEVTVTTSLQTSSGRMIFTRIM